MVWQIKTPILGFESLQSVVVKKIDDTFLTLHSTNESVISFTLANPYTLMQEYDIEIPQSLKLLLEIDDQTSIGVYCMVMRRDPVEESTVNLLAPLIINKDKKFMAQITLDPSKYPQYGLQEPLRSLIK